MVGPCEHGVRSVELEATAVVTIMYRGGDGRSRPDTGGE